MKLNPHTFPRQTFGQMTLLSLLGLTLTNCQLADLAKSEKSEKKADLEQLYPEPTVADLTPEAKEVNDAARLLAGLSALPDQDTNKQWRSENFWRSHKTGMEAMWTEFGSKRGIKVRKWAATEVADVDSTPVVFQPFGGPDFIFSHLLFPNAETYVVCGTAPCIDLPKLADVPAGVMADTIYALRASTASVLKTSARPDSAEHLPSGQAMQGALPMLMAIAARTGHIVESVELMPTDDSAPAVVTPGEIPLDPLAAGKAQASRSHPSSACMITLRTGDGRPRRLFYFQQDLTDEGLPESAALLQYLNKQSRVVVVVNDTGHELHQTNTLRLQQYIARHAVALVQDPSGVPYRHFSQDSWNIQRYGTYEGAPSEFRAFDQPELIAAYNDAKSKPQPLPFGRGSVDKEMPAALLVARPLVTNASDLPVNVEVAPLPEPAVTEPVGTPAATPAPAQSVVVTSATPSGPLPAPTTSQEPTEPLVAPLAPALSAVEASLGAPPLAPVDLTQKK